MIKNTAGQKIGAQMVSATDGSAFTSAVTVYVTLDAGTQAQGTVGSGACTHEGNGYHTYAPSQAETNGDLIGYTFIGTGAIPQTVQVYTIAGDAFTRLGAPAGDSVSADILQVKNYVDDIGVAGAGLTALGDTRIANLDAAITTRMASYTQPTGFLTATFPSGTIANTTNITAGTITTATNLTNAPTNGDFTSTMKTSIGTAVAASAVASVTGNVGGNVTGSVGSVVGMTASDVGAIKAKTDSLTFTVAGQVDSNIQYVNDVLVNGTGASGDEWGP